jgi:5-methylcytosine-specific restriction enzyme B
LPIRDNVPQGEGGVTIPAASREELLEAFKKFDRELRGSPEFTGWEEKSNYRYAIDYEGRRYPVKTIVSLAANVPTSGFSGGDEANGYVRARGFNVVALHTTFLRDTFETILSDYPTARTTQPFSHDNEIRKLFDAGERALSSPEFLGDKTIRVKASIGQGNWAKVPWIALLDPRVTDSTQRGVYVVLLFRQDGSGVYVTLNQGVTAPQAELGPAAGREQLRERARAIRASPEIRELANEGFRLDDGIDLRADPGLGRDYEASTIAYKLYEKGGVPEDNLITNDLHALLTAYNSYVTRREEQSRRAWIFQANPEFFDARGAVKELKELRWLVK